MQFIQTLEKSRQNKLMSETTFDQIFPLSSTPGPVPERDGFLKLDAYESDEVQKIFIDNFLFKKAANIYSSHPYTQKHDTAY